MAPSLELRTSRTSPFFFCLRQVLASVLVQRQMVERAANDELKDLKSVHSFVIITTDIQEKNASITTKGVLLLLGC